MFHYDTTQQEETLREREHILHWSASSHGWVAKTDEYSLFVPEKVYERAIQAYFTRLGIERKTYLDFMRPAEEAWQRQCEAERQFQVNLDQWLSSSERGVQIFPGK